MTVLRMLGFALLATMWAATVDAAGVTVGVNMTNADRLSPAEQEAMLGDMKAAGVHVVRAWVGKDADIALIERIYAHGMRVELGLPPTDPATPQRPAIKAAGAWAQARLSQADPTRWKSYFGPLFARMDKAGLRFAAIELGNEINTFGYNGDFAYPGEGRNMSLDDLYRDPEGQQVAQGLRRYVDVLATLKSLRDASKANAHTPILTAGLADDGPEGPRAQSKTDGASVRATIRFLRAAGIDAIVDAYAVHTYPWETTHEARLFRLGRTAISECGSKAEGRKPCWITEWGISNPDVSCPPNEERRSAVVRDMMGIFRQLVAARRIQGLLYYAWNTDPWQKTPSRWSLARCGSLTSSGRIALDRDLLR